MPANYTCLMSSYSETKKPIYNAHSCRYGNGQSPEPEENAQFLVEHIYSQSTHTSVTSTLLTQVTNIDAAEGDSREVKGLLPFNSRDQRGSHYQPEANHVLTIAKEVFHKVKLSNCVCEVEKLDAEIREHCPRS